MEQSISHSPSCDWRVLAALRKRGQRPADGVWLNDDSRGRRMLEKNGLFALGLPSPRDEVLLAGLSVVMYAKRTPSTIELAQRIAAINPRPFIVAWRNQKLQVVLPS